MGDIANGADSAGNLVLQPNGAILISGPHTNAGDTTRDLHAGRHPAKRWQDRRRRAKLEPDELQLRGRAL
jgi:hypothetical protein